jgi:Isochorismatase family
MTQRPRRLRLRSSRQVSSELLLAPKGQLSTTGQCTYRQNHPPLQFCWLRLLPNLLYIPKWRGSKETAVFAGELGAADIERGNRSWSSTASAVRWHDLETLLRANGIDTLMLAGVHSSGVVLSTVRHAGDLDYRLVVVRDCCADPDAEVHAMLLDIRHPEAGGRRHHGGVRRRPVWQVFMRSEE